MNLTWHGTATISISSGGSSILFDPFLPMNSRLPAPGIRKLALLGDIFITHGHFDHLMHVPAITRAAMAKIYCSETAAATLLREGVHQNRIAVVRAGDVIEKGPLRVRVYSGAHIRYDLPLVAKTLFSIRTFRDFNGLVRVLGAAKNYPRGDVLAFEVAAGSTKVLHLGSLNLDHSEKYPRGANLLTLPFQGRSDLNSYTLKLVGRLAPKALLLHHYDDSFPPITRPVDTSSFVRAAAGAYPELPVIVPEYGEAIVI